MLTRCPHCHASFPITLAQLKARQGDVRCGACRRVFNAEKYLFRARTSAGKTTTLASDHRASGTQGSSPLFPEVDANYARIFTGNQEISPQEQRSKADSTWWSWAFAVAVASVMLIAQIVLYFRSEIAAVSAADRPYLATLCKPFGCQVGLPAKPDFLLTDNAYIHLETDGKRVLFVTLKNRGNIVIEYPHIELTLTDNYKQPLLRRILAPTEYLPVRTVAAAGFPARAEVNLSLVLSSSVPWDGYRLYLFYP
jgi:predicted Zn finger-like uncharacterized protein